MKILSFVIISLLGISSSDYNAILQLVEQNAVWSWECSTCESDKPEEKYMKTEGLDIVSVFYIIIYSYAQDAQSWCSSVELLEINDDSTNTTRVAFHAFLF